MKQLKLFIVVLFIGMAAEAQNTDLELRSYVDSLNFAEHNADKTRLSCVIADKLKDSDWSQALKYIELGAQHSKKANSKANWAYYYEKVGDIYYFKDVLDVALEYYLKALQQLDPIVHADEVNNLNHSMAIIYSRLGEQTKSVSYFKQVLRHFESRQDTLRTAVIYNNLLKVYQSQQKDSALYFFKKCQHLLKYQPNNFTDVNAHINMARHYLDRNDTINSYAYLTKALKIAKVSKTDKLKMYVYQDFTNYYETVNNVDSTLEYALQTKAALLKKQPSLKAYNFLSQECAKSLYEAYLKKKDYQEATHYFSIYNDIRDSLNLEEKVFNAQRLKLQQEYQDKTKADAFEAQKQWYVFMSVALGLIVLALLLLLLLIRNKHRLAKQQVQHENTLLKQEQLH